MLPVQLYASKFNQTRRFLLKIAAQSLLIALIDERPLPSDDLGSR